MIISETAPIQAVIFDFGGVLLRTHDRAPRRAWSQRLGLPPDGVEELFFNSPQGIAAQHGRIDEASHWRWVTDQLGLDAADATALMRDFWAGDRIDDALMAYIAALRPRYCTAIISNAPSALRQQLAERWGILDQFDLVVVSAEFGVMKPDAAIFAHTLDQLGIAPAQAIFIDDFAHNVAGAHAAGLAAIHYPPQHNAADLIAALAARGVAPAGATHNVA